MSIIYELDKTGVIKRCAIYSCEPRQAIIAYIMQKEKNGNTWLYPNDLPGIKKSKTKKGCFYYYDQYQDKIIASYWEE